MGNKISCANCNGKPAPSSTASNTMMTTTSTTSSGHPHQLVANVRGGHYSHHYHHQQASGGGGGGGTTMASGRGSHLLRLWAEVFHVSASSGAVRWNQVSDDLVPITVQLVQGKYHIMAFNSRVEKVLDCYLQATKLGQASNCFIYWKDNNTGDTWGLNFTSPADARTFRECIQSGTFNLQTSGHVPKRTESSYSLRDQTNTQQQHHQQQPSKAGSGAHLTTKYYANRTAISTPNSPSKRRLQSDNLQHHQQQQQQPQCTCDCLTADMLHKQRNGRIRYANFTRQDSGGTTQSSRSDGSLVRRQQQFYRGHQRSVDEHYRSRLGHHTGGIKTLDPSHRSTRIQQTTNNPQQTRMHDVGNYPQMVQQNGGYLQQQKAIVHTSGRQHGCDQPRPQSVAATSTTSAHAPKTKNLVSTATTTDDLPHESLKQQQPQRSQRPKSLVSMDSDKCRDRTHRSLEGRRRSLERMQCVDLADASPPTPARNEKNQHHQSSLLRSGSSDDRPSAAQLDEYERELRRRLLHGGDSQNEAALETFETLLKESMDDVANLMREVQQELSLIRAEEKRYQSQSTQSLHRLSSVGLGNAPRSPVFDTMSIDGQLPFLPSFATSLASASSAYHNAYQSWDRGLGSGGIGGYLTSSEVSDDDRASLTTAISDDEDIINNKSSFKQKRSSSVSFECLGSVRKSGFLSVKKWLIRKRHTLELARRRGWKGYWVCLKGTTLLFYSCDASSTTSASGNTQADSGRGQSSSSTDLTPKHLIFVDDCLVQPVPEHPRRDNVFCLSTSIGDAYLFDATSLPERDQWINVIHTACAAQIARNSGRCAISHYLIDEYQRIDKLVEQDLQARQEAELLLSCCAEEKQKQQLVNHVFLVEEKIERNRMDTFKLKSYLAALTQDEGPNPKTLLSQTSRRTKAQLNRIGIFTVSSLHAFNCAKNPQALEKLHRQNSLGSSGGSGTDVRELYSPSQDLISFASGPRVTLQVLMLTGEQRAIEVPQSWTSEQVMADLYGPGSESREYFFRCSETGTILYRNDLVGNYANHTLLVTPKLLFTIDLVRETNEILFGFSVESELINSNLRVFVMRVEANSIAAIHGLCRHDEIMVINGALVQELDMMFVESILQEELTLCLMIRSSRLEIPSQGQMISKSESINNQQLVLNASFDNEKTSSVTDELIESLVCPPPPSSDFSQLVLSDLSKYIVPKVDNFLPTSENLIAMNTAAVAAQLVGSSSSFTLMTPGVETMVLNNSTAGSIVGDNQSALQLLQESLANGLLSDTNDPNKEDIYSSQGKRLGGAALPTTGSLNRLSNKAASIKHMEKLIRELIDTENSYCQSLEQLVKLYLEPLSKNNFLTQNDVKVLFGSILKVIDAQNEFRSELIEVGEHILGDCKLLFERCNSMTESEPNINELGVGYIADCFAKHSKNFRYYSTFCASHARASKLMADEKTALHAWLQKQANGQLSQSLESYLIRPIQRVLKYPLLLGQMKALCTKDSINHNKLEDAIKDLEKVAEHINEMQRIQEEYGAIFEHLAQSHTRLSNTNGLNFGQNGMLDLSPPALKHYGNVDWINSMEFLGKNCRKGVELNSVCFVFSQCVIFLCKETIRHRKRMPSARSTDVEIIRHQVLIPVIEVQVRACPQNENETDFRWELIQLKMNAGKRSEKIYRLSNKLSEERNDFLRIIRQIIREDVRRMNVFSKNQGTSGGSSGGSGVGSGPDKTSSSGSKPSRSNKSEQSSKNQQKHTPAPSTTTSTFTKRTSAKDHHHQQQQQQQQHSQHHEQQHDFSSNKVPCGLCGKEVALGQRQKELITANWKQRQDSSSTTSH